MEKVESPGPCASRAIGRNRGRRENQRKARTAIFERIIEHAPASFNTAQTSVFLGLLILMEPYDYLEAVAAHFAKDDENTELSDNEIVLKALGESPDEKLTCLALRIVLSDHVSIPRENEPDILAETEAVFLLKKPKATKAPAKSLRKAKPATAKSPRKKDLF